MRTSAQVAGSVGTFGTAGTFGTVGTVGAVEGRPISDDPPTASVGGTGNGVPDGRAQRGRK
jgi:hypothetical protein